MGFARCFPCGRLQAAIVACSTREHAPLTRRPGCCCGSARPGHDVFNALDIFENEKILKGGCASKHCMAYWMAWSWSGPVGSEAGADLRQAVPHPAVASLHVCPNQPSPRHPNQTHRFLQSSSLASATASCGTTCSTGGSRRTSRPTKWGWSCSEVLERQLPDAGPEAACRRPARCAATLSTFRWRINMLNPVLAALPCC